MLRNACLAAMGLAAIGVGVRPTVAHACGGCFAPTGQPSVVTAHRMVVAINATETTLWDQFEYDGDPDDFVWVLPIANHEGVEIELAEQAFFLYLQGKTNVTLQAPAPPSSGGGGGFCAAQSASAPRSADMTSPVEVYSQGVVGPYETLVLGSDSGMSLVDWLQANGYSVSDALVPTIMHYIDQGMDFVVLRLTPNAGVNQIQPVRVTTPGLQMTFPLRMIAAGAGVEVSLELYVIGEGRYEAQNFPNAEISESELVFDWSDSTFNYDVVREDKLAQDGGRTWLTEFSDAIGGGDVFDANIVDEEGVVHRATPDWSVATRNLLSAPWVTRMRAELPTSALVEDLELRASVLPRRPGFYFVTRELNRPNPGFAPLIGTGGRLWPILLFVVPVLAFLALRRRRWAEATMTRV